RDAAAPALALSVRPHAGLLPTQPLEQAGTKRLEWPMSRATRGAVSSSELTPASIPAPAANVVIRPLKTMEDCHACVELQREVWGFNQADVVPATLLHVVEYVGGL